MPNPDQENNNNLNNQSGDNSGFPKIIDVLAIIKAQHADYKEPPAETITDADADADPASGTYSLIDSIYFDSDSEAESTPRRLGDELFEKFKKSYDEIMGDIDADFDAESYCDNFENYSSENQCGGGFTHNIFLGSAAAGETFTNPIANANANAVEVELNAVTIVGVDGQAQLICKMELNEY